MAGLKDCRFSNGISTAEDLLLASRCPTTSDDVIKEAFTNPRQSVELYSWAPQSSGRSAARITNFISKRQATLYVCAQKRPASLRFSHNPKLSPVVIHT
jgi:hypothetical protein